MAKVNPQKGVLAPTPSRALFLSFQLKPHAHAVHACRALASLPYDAQVLLGIGAPLVDAAAQAIPGHRPFPSDLGLFPATQAALWLRLAHQDPSRCHDVARGLLRGLEPAFDATEEVSAFVYRNGRDLSGFRDGTENPRGAAAAGAALVRKAGAGLDGGSFVMVQRWVHDMKALHAMSQPAREAMVGRRQVSDKELVDAPPSAHVKRTAQEGFAPPAFMVRRSMPYSHAREQGLYFVAFVASLDGPERMLHRMAGRDDGIPDALFSFSRPVTGSFFFCPPVRRGTWDLRALLPE